MNYSMAIRGRVEQAKSGKLFVMQDFADLAPNNVGNRVVKRLVDEGILQTVVRGVYVKPKYNAFLGETEKPSVEEVARAIGRKNGWLVRPDGDMALNMLGLSTQVPAAWTFVSDGPYKTYTYGAGQIRLKHSANRLMAKLSWDAALLVQAFRAMGEERVDEPLLRRLASRYSAGQLERMTGEMMMAPDWIRSKVKQMKEFVQ